ncbi:MAG: archease [bacterium]
MPYTFQDHTADVMVVIQSNSIHEFFNDLLEALWSLFTSKNEKFLKNVEKMRKQTFTIKYQSYDELVYNFISRFIYFVEVKRKVIRLVEDLQIHQGKAIFKAKVIEIQKFVSYLKAPTYHNMEIDLDRYYGRIVLDV